MARPSTRPPRTNVIRRGKKINHTLPGLIEVAEIGQYYIMQLVPRAARGTTDQTNQPSVVRER